MVIGTLAKVYNEGFISDFNQEYRKKSDQTDADNRKSVSRFGNKLGLGGKGKTVVGHIYDWNLGSSKKIEILQK